MCVVFVSAFIYVCTCGCVSVQKIRESRMSAHLKALRADFLAFLHPGDSGFGIPGGLAHKRRNSSRDARLVLWGFDETWQAWGSGSKGGREVIKGGRERSQGQGKRGRREGGREEGDVSAYCQSHWHVKLGYLWVSLSPHKGTMRKNPHWHCCCAHLQLSHGRNIQSLCGCLSPYHVEFLTPAFDTPFETAKFVAHRQWSCISVSWTWGTALNPVDETR